MSRHILLLVFLVSAAALPAQEQSIGPQKNSDQRNSVPSVVKFTGSLRGSQVQPSTVPIGITFALYKDEVGGAPLWMETQNVTLGSQRRFTVFLGANSVEGLPADVFAGGEARWLGVTPNGEGEEARIMLASVPYALEAADAQTVNGRNPEDFVTLEQLASYLPYPLPQLAGTGCLHLPCFIPTPSLSKTNNFEAVASSGPSFISDAITGPPLEINSNTLVSNLNVDLLHGFTDASFAKLNSNNQFTLTQQFNGGVMFPPIPGKGEASESSSPQDFEATGNSSAGLISQLFRWQANGSDQNGSQPQLSLSFGSVGQKPTPTGFSLKSDGTINFAPGQTFPATAIMTAITPLLKVFIEGVGVGGVGVGGVGVGGVSVGGVGVGRVGVAGGGGGGVGSASGVSRPSGNQNVNQPPGTSNNTRTVQPRDNWSVGSIATPITSGTPTTITLTPCPRGVDTSGSAVLGGATGGYPVRITDGTLPNTNSESVYVTGGTCKSEATSGTIIFTSYFSHAMSNYTIGSDSKGIQEAINDACGTSRIAYENSDCDIVIPPTAPLVGYDIYDTIYFHANGSLLSGYGAILNCHGRGPCLQVGDLINANDYANNTVEGISFRTADNRRSDPAFSGSSIVSTQTTAGTIIVQTSAPHNFRTGDRVTQMLTDFASDWGDVPSITVIDATHYSHTRTNAKDAPLQATPGVVALSYEAVLDNANSTSLADLQYENTGEDGAFNHFFDFWDDENAQIDKFNNNAISLNANANWTGSFVWSGGQRNLPNSNQQLAPVITVTNSSFTANGSNCATVYNSNGFYFQNSVCQASGPWEFLVSTVNGNYQGAAFQNISSESGLGANPASPTRSPWPGLGIAGFIGGSTSATATYSLSGEGGFAGALPTVGSGSTTYVYYVVARDLANGSQTSPLPFMYEQEDSPSQVTVQWPRLAAGSDAIVYDVIRNPAPQGTMSTANGGYVAPYAGGCLGGGISACGSVALRLAQCAGLVCSFTDNTANATSAYFIANADFAPNPTFWPGMAVLTNTALQSTFEMPITGIAFNGAPSQYATYCSDYGANVSGGYTVCSGSPTSSNNSVPDQAPLILTDGPTADGGGLLGAKGRLIFESAATTGWFNSHQIITLYDSNPGKTQATTGHRPVGDPGDMYLGYDPNHYLMIGGGAQGIAQYVNNIGDGTNLGELLTSARKTFNVPAQFNRYAQFDQRVFATAGCMGCSPFNPVGTQVADNFPYAGSLNSNWVVEEGAWAVANGWATATAVGNDSLAFAIYSGATFANDQAAQATYNGSGYSGICVRTANTASLSGYCLGGGSGDTDVSYLTRIISGTRDTLCTLSYSGMGLGTTLHLSAIGTTITANFVNNGVQTNMCSVTDSNITSGYPAIVGGGPGGALSNFIAGDAAASTSQNISFNGAISLNGPVSVNGAAGFSGTKTAGSCVFTIVNGIITNATGC
jgi:hypothetical protein